MVATAERHTEPTRREMDVPALRADGLSNKDIGDQMGIAENT